MASNYFTVTGKPGIVEIRRYTDGSLVETFHEPGAEASALTRIRQLDQEDRLGEMIEGDAVAHPPAPPPRTKRVHPLREVVIASKTGLIFWVGATILSAIGTFQVIEGFVAMSKNSQPVGASTKSPGASMAYLGGMFNTSMGVWLLFVAFVLFVLGLVLHYLKSIAVETRRANERS